MMNSDLYPLLKNYKPGITEKAYTSPFFERNESSYPDPFQNDLRKLYARHLTSIDNINFGLSEKNILFTNGCSDAIDLTLRAFCNPYVDIVNVYTPVFPLYKFLATNQHIEVMENKLSGPNYNILPNVNRSVHPKIHFICSPNNPTGICVSHDCIEDYAKSDSLVVIDETYIEYSSGPSCIHLMQKYKNILILRSFSKAWGLAGYRCGAIIGDPNLIQKIREKQIPFSFSSPAQKAVEEKIKNYQQVKEMVNFTNEEKRKLLSHIEKGEFANKIFETQTNFLFLILKKRSTHKFLLRNLKYVTDFSNQLEKSIKIGLYDKHYNIQLIEKIELLNKT